jgi:hypothetical protein
METLTEGRCAQTLHIGSCDDEADALARMHHAFILDSDLHMVGKHHEIYRPYRIPASTLSAMGDHRMLTEPDCPAGRTWSRPARPVRPSPCPQAEPSATRYALGDPGPSRIRDEPKRGQD